MPSNATCTGTSIPVFSLFKLSCSVAIFCAVAAKLNVVSNKILSQLAILFMRCVIVWLNGLPSFLMRGLSKRMAGHTRFLGRVLIGFSKVEK